MINSSTNDCLTKLTKHYQTIKNINLRDLFSEDANRFDKFNMEFENILLDYSKNHLTLETIKLLTEFAKEKKLSQKIDDMFSGKNINITEKRAVLHSALRDKSDVPIYVEETNVTPLIKAVLNKMDKFCADFHSGKFTGYTGKKFNTIVNIGIGGSDLGPAMVCKALKPYRVEGMNSYFVSNVDGSHLAEVLKEIDAETTLFIIASKTFTTQETITNALSARDWFLNQSSSNTEHVAKHFVALSTNRDEVIKFGINPDNMFEFWDWVGGRYSLWSAIGLSIALYIGFDNFNNLLEGAYLMDVHFRTAPFESNIPVLLALIGFWYINFFGAKTHVVIPYDQYLEYLPDFIQQLDMESNGKSIDINGNKVDYPTGSVIWGKPGTNAQHSFFQLIHQGTQLIPCDFLAPVFSHNEIGDHHQKLISNFFAQTEALMMGKSKEEVISELQANGLTNDEIKFLAPHKVFEGNKPTNTIFYNKLTPSILGSLIAMYEHKVFVQGVLWNINSFDQWGVELGKQLAKVILPELSSTSVVGVHDSSTIGLINFYRNKHGKSR